MYLGKWCPVSWSHRCLSSLNQSMTSVHVDVLLTLFTSCSPSQHCLCLSWVVCPRSMCLSNLGSHSTHTRLVLVFFHNFLDDLLRFMCTSCEWDCTKSISVCFGKCEEYNINMSAQEGVNYEMVLLVHRGDLRVVKGKTNMTSSTESIIIVFCFLPPLYTFGSDTCPVINPTLSI